MNENTQPKKCCKGGCSSPSRREILKILGAGAAAAALGPSLQVVAGPFEASDLEKLVPADKKLHPEWVRSLFARGEPAVYRGADLRWIGMPVGGICSGQLYLGGDGRLWHWDIFNQHIGTGDAHYANPMEPTSPIEQGFAIRTRTGGDVETRALDRTGFADVSFRGEYPMGIVEYRDPRSAVRVRLEAFSPFVPLETADSALPATVMRFTVENAGASRAECQLVGWLENAVCLHTGQPRAATRILRPIPNLTFLEHSVSLPPPESRGAPREDVIFDDFEKEGYEGWTVTGTAFGKGPAVKEQIPSYQGDVGGQGRRVVNSHATAPGGDVGEKDSQVGTLTSRTFKIARDYINLFVGGGAHRGRTCVNILVDDGVVLSATGANDNRMKPQSLDVRPWAGKTARIQIVDEERGGWGNIGVDQIVFSDSTTLPDVPLEERSDFGTLGLALLGDGAEAIPSIAEGPLPDSAFTASNAPGKKPRAKPCGSLARAFALEPGEKTTVAFVVAWHFPNLSIPPLPKGRRYATRFTSAAGVAEHLASNVEKLEGATRLWRDTWYDSTLPFWFLDRVLANASILATSTSHWLSNGRFYGWEGVGCCAGTCAHVWHYAHAMARLFPELERAAREMADYGAGFDAATGRIRFRAEHADHWAVDGQSGCILRAYREHQMSSDDSFLRRIWPRVKQSVEFLMGRDPDENGIIDGAQHNTLDADWFGQVAWLSGLYLAALRAGEEMAKELGDAAFARRCREIFEKGRRSIDEKLFNGEYYVQIGDPAHAGTVGSYDGCEVDQVFCQSWAWQVGLGRILDESKVKTALRSLWRYNFTPDVGPYRAEHKPGRWYAMPGEGGLLMCTWPRGAGKRVQQSFDFYFNECMNGFEYQAAGHMIAEGMVLEGLAIARMIHDRYHPSRRNPWNEVECGDHYARSMASFGVYLTACGYEHHGPRRHIGFAPRISPESFRAAFTAAEGWGTFSQQIQGGTQRAGIAVKWGLLRLRTVSLGVAGGASPTKVSVTLDGRPVAAQLTVGEGRAVIRLEDETTVNKGSSLEIELS